MQKAIHGYIRALITLNSILFLTSCSYFNGPPLESVWDDGLIEPTTNKSEVTVTHLGVTTMVVTDGQTTLLIDGFFSRPSSFSILFKRPIRSNPDKIKDGLQDGGVDKLDAVFVLHSHYDHAFDVAEVINQQSKKGTQPKIYGSKSTYYIVKESGDDKSFNLLDPAEDPIKVGDFTVTPYYQEHIIEDNRGDQIDGEIEGKVAQPVSYIAYKQGKAYVLKIEHKNKSVVIYGSAGPLIKGQGPIAENVDTVFMGIGLLGKKLETDFNPYWNEISSMNPKRIIPTHWDNPTRARLTDTLSMRTNPNMVDDVGATLDKLKEATSNSSPKISLEVIPMSQPIPLFAN